MSVFNNSQALVQLASPRNSSRMVLRVRLALKYG
jgi:hypothetical protein